MHIHIDGSLYGIEIPALTDIVRKMRTEGRTPDNMAAYKKVHADNASLFEHVNAFLLKNGAPTPFGPVVVMSGLISHDVKAAHIPCGITFFVSEELAQKVAAAFPAQKVIRGADGQVIAPVPKKAPAPRRKPSGPKP